MTSGTMYRKSLQYQEIYEADKPTRITKTRIVVGTKGEKINTLQPYEMN